MNYLLNSINKKYYNYSITLDSTYTFQLYCRNYAILIKCYDVKCGY